MILVAAGLTGLSAYLLAGLLTGNAPELRRRRHDREAVSRRQTWLTQAGADLTPQQFFAGSVGAGLAAFALAFAITATPAVAVVPAVAVGFLPRSWFARRRVQRLRRLQEAWPDGIRDLLAGISAGLSLHQAMVGLATTGPDALRDAFRRYPTLARVLGVVPALEVVKEELADPTSDRVIEVLVLAHEKGGHILAEILHDLADATTRDVRALEQIATDSLEQRINARAVFVLPWLVLVVLTARAGFFRDFYRSPGGIVVIVLAALMSMVGIALVSRLSREPVEQRVLGGRSHAAQTELPR